MRFITYNAKNFREIEYMKYLPDEVKNEIDVVASVIPFKTNNYVTDYLIDWQNYQEDPVYVLNFPNKNMLTADQYERASSVLSGHHSKLDINRTVNRIRMEMNPHPAQQMTNVPVHDGVQLTGSQHKYRDIILFFPSQGQTCHAHCTFCFRWPQFVKDLDLKFSMREIAKVAEYIKRNESIREILFTGGDPMVMSPAELSPYIDALLDPELENLAVIRFGSKSLAYWPFTFLPEFNDEAGDMLDLFSKITENGKHLSFMAHFNHPVELDNHVVRQAIHNIRATGAEIRTQAPVLNHINNDSNAWARMWQMQVELGLIPYYMFVERETGPYDYFRLPLAEVYGIYQRAVMETGSLAKTVTGPVMSADKGKVHIMGIVTNPSDGNKYFMMQYVRHRDYTKTLQPFFMHFDEEATWVDQLTEVKTVNISVNN
jgi:L-lysine 2,3-aminomutase